MPLKHVDVKLLHLQRASAGPDIMDKFERVITLDGDLSSEQRQALLGIAERCPVSKTIRQASEIVSVLSEATVAVPP